MQTTLNTVFGEFCLSHVSTTKVNFLLFVFVSGVSRSDWSFHLGDVDLLKETGPSGHCPTQRGQQVWPVKTAEKNHSKNDKLFIVFNLQYSDGCFLGLMLQSYRSHHVHTILSSCHLPLVDCVHLLLGSYCRVSFTAFTLHNFLLRA